MISPPLEESIPFALYNARRVLMTQNGIVSTYAMIAARIDIIIVVKLLGLLAS